MNYPITIVGILTLLALLAHGFAGYRESLSTRPPTDRGEAITRNWVQSICAFQLVTVDLLFLSALMIALGTIPELPARRELAWTAAAFYASWGIAWLVQLLLLRQSGKQLLLLGQWLLWFCCAGLLVWGAESI